MMSQMGIGRGMGVINRKRRNLRFSCNFDIFPGAAESFAERLVKEKVLLYKFNRSMDGLSVRFVVATVTDKHSSVFVRYSTDNWTSEADLEMTTSGCRTAYGNDGCFYDATVPLSMLMPMDYDSIQFRVGCSDGRLEKLDNNDGVMYVVQRLPSDDNNNNNAMYSSINPGQGVNLV